VTSGVDSEAEPGLSAGAPRLDGARINTACRVPLALIAFGDRPDAPIVLSAEDPPLDRWLAAVALGARGRYASAATLLDRLLRGRWAGATTVRAHAAVTRAAHLRQVGGHGAARRWDALGLALATSADARAGRDAPGSDPGWDRTAARVDALLGLAADAIGLGELNLADRLLRAAEPAAAEHPSWRPGVRWHWVRAELALCRDRPEEAADLGVRALRAARRAGATRHEIKSAVVVAAAEMTAARDLDRLADRLLPLAERARLCELRTLEWPIQLQLATLKQLADPAAAARHRREATRIVGRIARQGDPIIRSVAEHSPWVPRPPRLELLHSEADHPGDRCHSAHSSRMECNNPP
jgi:hypothetical protein